MSDRDLRRAEREAHADPEAAARLLVARVRAGALGSQRLKLAAKLGHEAAARALGAPGASFVTVDALVDVIDDVYVAIHALALAVRRIAPEEPDPISRARVDAAAAWSECPCEAHAREARRLQEVPEFALGLRGPYVEGALRVVQAAHLFQQGGGNRGFFGMALRCLREGTPDEAALASGVRDDLLRWLLA